MPFSEEEIGEGMTTDPTFLTRGSRFPNEDVIVPTAFEIEKGSKSLRWRVSSCDGFRFSALAAAWRFSWVPGGKGLTELSAIWDTPAMVNERAVARPMSPYAPVMKTAWALLWIWQAR